MRTARGFCQIWKKLIANDNRVLAFNKAEGANADRQRFSPNPGKSPCGRGFELTGLGELKGLRFPGLGGAKGVFAKSGEKPEAPNWRMATNPRVSWVAYLSRKGWSNYPDLFSLSCAVLT